MLSTRLQPYSHEDIFLQRYQWLRDWSLQLTQHDQEQAEDLVHDVFIQFTMVRPDLAGIQNIEGYLYTMLRNMRLSNLRRAARAPSRPLSILDFDSAEVVLRTVGPRERIEVREQLWLICQYACVRKETSKAGSILILRFFHGYYPGEIAQILKGPRRAVDDWVSIARREAKRFLENPAEPIAWKTGNPEHRSDSISGDTVDFLEGPRRAIFRSRKGTCLTDKALRELYLETDEHPIDCAFLSHLVSCPNCLETINDILGLPPASDRYPTDMLGPDIGGSNAPRRDRSSSKPPNRFAATLARRARDVFDHSPTELSLAVNGFVLSSQTLGPDLTRQTLTVNTSEKVGFVEAFSEQGIRLLYLPVDQPPDGPVEQSAEVEFGGGRTLSLSIGFSGSWPVVSAVYRDPQCKLADLPDQSPDQSMPDDCPAAAEPVPRVRAGRAEILGLRPAAVSWLAALRRWVRPSTITAALAVLLILAVLIVPFRGPSVSAAELLTRAGAAEETAQKTPGALIHRVFDFEKRAAKDGAPAIRHRIETWLDPSKGIQARRVFDEKNRIVAAEWTNYDGLRWVYQPDAALQFQQEPQRNAKAILETGDLWQLNLSAQDFSAIVGQIGMASVTRQADTYVISYRNASSAGSNLLQEARITLTRTDLHAVEQSLVVRQGGEAIEYKFVENTLDRVRRQQAGPSIFQIAPELMTGVPGPKSVTPSPATPDASNNPAPASLTTQELSNLALDALYQLHRVGACTEEQATVSRTSAGGLRIQAVVASEKRKRDILHALTSLGNNPALDVEIDTESEAAQRHLSGARGPTTARDFEITLDRIPAYDELRRYYARVEDENGRSSPAASARIDEDTRRFAAVVLSRSRQALADAWALKRHVDEISSGELSLLDPERQARFRSMVADHAAAYRQEMRKLRAELQPVFMPAGLARESVGSTDSSENRRDVETARARKLFELTSTIDEEVRRAFSFSVEGPEVLQIKTERFWRSLELAERLARSVKDR